MPYCFEFTFTFILVNKKIQKKKSGEGVVREERDEMIPPHTSWTGPDALFSSMRPQSGRAYRARMSPAGSGPRPHPFGDGSRTNGEPQLHTAGIGIGPGRCELWCGSRKRRC